MYGIYTDHELEMKKYYLIDYHVFPQIDISECSGVDDFKSRMTELLEDDKAEVLWLLKKDRKLLADKYLDFETIDKVIKEYWGNSIICA